MVLDWEEYQEVGRGNVGGGIVMELWCKWKEVIAAAKKGIGSKNITERSEMVGGGCREVNCY